jgi:hypothetical protein
MHQRELTPAVEQCGEREPLDDLYLVDSEPPGTERMMKNFHALESLGFFFEKDDVIEIRALNVDGRDTAAGYFELTNQAAIDQAIASVNRRSEGVYCVLNKINPALLARSVNHMRQRAKNLTTDADMIEWRWFLIDFDPVRPAGISSTEDEHRAALALAQRVREFLASLGWPEPFFANSGNGAHLLYRLPALMLDQGTVLLKACLEALAAMFDYEAVKIDTSTYNRSRLCKLYGTVSRKGDSTAERPHRVAQLLRAPADGVIAVSVEALEALAAQAPKKQQARPENKPPLPSFDIDHWLARSGLEIIRGPEAYEGGRRWTLRVCPFNEEHQKPVILQLASGALVYRCLHKSCEANDWRALKARFDPPPQTSHEAKRHSTPLTAPVVLTVPEILGLYRNKPSDLIEGIASARGACILHGAAKSGKTILAFQMCDAVARGQALFDKYRVQQGPTMLIEQDDPAGAESIQDMIQRSSLALTLEDVPFYLVTRIPFPLGPDFIDWLKAEILRLKLNLVVLDSYTALREQRKGSDIVKIEQSDMRMLDQLGKETNCLLLIVHHGSKGSIHLNWTERAAGTFAMSAAVEAQIHISRFDELGSNAAERLVRVRGRHQRGTEFVLRFRETSLDYEHVLESSAASFYPMILQLQREFGNAPFSPKKFSGLTALSLATVHRHLERLHIGGLVKRLKFGEWQLQ